MDLLAVELAAVEASDGLADPRWGRALADFASPGRNTATSTVPVWFSFDSGPATSWLAVAADGISGFCNAGGH